MTTTSAPTLDRVAAHKWAGHQMDVLFAIADTELESDDTGGCSPWACRSGAPTIAERFTRAV
ncbi:hypothetical protein [Kitasatospora griseola]|uniref:hypothetical protein n=1 Tax=Kitasatospora griseola TaxID=2064 RepID=UPI00343840DB